MNFIGRFDETRFDPLAEVPYIDHTIDIVRADVPSVRWFDRDW